MNITPSNFVQIQGTQVSVVASGLAEVRMALKELKLKKKEFGIQKKLIMAQQKEIHASYTNEVRTRGSMVRGGGGIGKIFRAIQTVSRDSKRSTLAADLAPLERAMQEVEAILIKLDQAILKLEIHLIQYAV